MTAHGQQPDLFATPASEGGGVGRLTAWQPACWTVDAGWKPVVDHFFASPAGQQLAEFITQRIAAGACIYPPQPLRALALTRRACVKVVILGQDPYHGPGQAEGLAFSVAAGCKIPPSLRNIFKELALEARQANPSCAAPQPSNGSLVRWAEQGVLLLNTCLTVEQGVPASHANRGWESLTDALIQAVLDGGRPVVFLLWGAHAQRVAARVDASAGGHLVLQANHPSPLSALRPPSPFLGCGHFRLANEALIRWGDLPINW